LSRQTLKMELKHIPIDKIDISEGNVRRKKITEGLDELKRSIELIGLQQPPIVFKKNDRYELIVGQRRLIAMSQLGWKTVPALIRSSIDITEAKIASLSENIQRVALSARDMSDVCNYLLDKLGTAKAVAEALGVNPITVNKYLGYRIVPEPLKKMVDKKKITAPDAIKITANLWPDEEKAIKVAEKIAKMPRPEKDRVFDAVREAPEEPVERILEIADKARIRREIVIHLPEKYADALDRASKHLRLEPEDIAKNAVTEWLEEKGYA